MPIISYVPPTKKIIDHRSDNGGYYVAICEVCGSEFYPKRSTAKYCTPNCGLIAHRTAIAKGEKPKKVKSEAKPSRKKDEVQLLGRDAVVSYLRTRVRTVHGLKTKLFLLDVGSTMIWKDRAEITRISPLKYSVVLILI